MLTAVFVPLFVFCCYLLGLKFMINSGDRLKGFNRCSSAAHAIPVRQLFLC